MKTKKRPVRKTVKRTTPTNYSCGVCGTVIEVDPCGCGCGTAAELVCCGQKMAKKS